MTGRSGTLSFCVLVILSPAGGGRFLYGGRREHGAPYLVRLRLLALIVHLPVIVRAQEHAISIVELERRICQRVRNSHRRQGRSDPADEDVAPLAAVSQDESADHYIVARLDKTAGADVGHL